MSLDGWWTLLAALAMFIGLAGVVVPILPGLLVILASAIAYGFAVGFGPLGVAVIGLHIVLVVASFVTGVLLPKKEAELSGASKISQFGGLVGAVVGFFLIPVVGIFVGALLGVVLAEYTSKGNWAAAWDSAKGVVKGFGKSVLADGFFGLVMIAAWSIWALTVLT